MSLLNFKTLLEQQHLQYFITHNIGKQFLQKLHIVQIIKRERPDFILCNAQGIPYGLEVTVLDTEQKNEQFFKSIDGVVKKLFAKITCHLNKKYFINLICLEKNLGEVKFKSAELLEKLFEIIKNDDGEQSDCTLTYQLGRISISGRHKQKQIEMSNGVQFLMIYSPNDKNVGGTPVFGAAMHNPIQQMQNLITKKNNLISSYYPCEQQFLLMVVDPFITKGGFFTFDDNCFRHEFIGNFSKIFLLILGGKQSIEVVEIQNAKK